jgi:hypothetical protein
MVGPPRLAASLFSVARLVGPVRRHTAMNVRNRLTLTEQRRATFMALIDL